MDFSDVIVHIFYEPVREFYDLDGPGVTRLELSCPNLTQPWSISFKPRIIRYRSRMGAALIYTWRGRFRAGISKERKAS